MSTTPKAGGAVAGGGRGGGGVTAVAAGRLGAPGEASLLALLALY